MNVARDSCQQLSAKPWIRARTALAAVAALTLLAAGCYRETRLLKLHYIAQFVPGTRAIFAPIPIAVAPTGGLAMQSEIAVGTITDEAGSIVAHLAASDLAALMNDALIASLIDSGLKPALLAARPPDLKLTGGAFLLACDIAKLAVNKRFRSQRTVHGQVFTMQASAQIVCSVHGRSGRQIFAATITGDESEPPKPVGNEAFLPLETDPAESLSVALSRAIGGLILMLKDRATLPILVSP
jgi:hypothetical protein